MMQTDDRLAVSAKEAARMLGISERLLWSLSTACVIPSVRIARRRLYRPVDLAVWLDQQAAKAAK